MNNFTRRELEEDTSGLLEVCDFCNNLIFNWNTLENAKLQFNGKIACQKCSTWNNFRVFGSKSDVSRHIQSNFSPGAVKDWEDFSSNLKTDTISTDIYNDWLNQYIGLTK